MPSSSITKKLRANLFDVIVIDGVGDDTGALLDCVVELTDEGMSFIEGLLKGKGLFRRTTIAGRVLVGRIENALKAHTIFDKDKQYIPALKESVVKL